MKKANQANVATKKVAKRGRPKKSESIKKAAKKAAMKQKPDDLNKILGFTRKYQNILKESGVADYYALGNCTMKRLLMILEDAGITRGVDYYATWARQAKLAYNEKWDELADYQKRITKVL
jgi:predicted flap endonuclease-1-like 5' DNA nuclease